MLLELTVSKSLQGLKQFNVCIHIHVEEGIPCISLSGIVQNLKFNLISVRLGNHQVCHGMCCV